MKKSASHTVFLGSGNTVWDEVFLLEIEGKRFWRRSEVSEPLSLPQDLDSTSGPGEPAGSESAGATEEGLASEVTEARVPRVCRRLPD